MKKRVQKVGNKGFSLIELIIVIAIMAILVGALAPQYLTYVERTRRANDIQTADAIRNAVLVAVATDPAAAATYSYNTASTGIGAQTTGWQGSVAGIIGTTARIQSIHTPAYTDFQVIINGNNIAVWITDGTTPVQLSPAPTVPADVTLYDNFRNGR